VFDCDGVLLNSNAIKTRAFGVAAEHYGADASRALVEYHVSNGGVSRYKKVDYLFSNILQRAPETGETDDVLGRYANYVEAELMACEVAPGLEAFLASLSDDASRIVVSGSDQRELRRVLKNRGLAALFDGVFGSPDSKDEILTRELAAGTIGTPAVFVGDSRYDYEAAARHEMDFVFLSEWSEFADWPQYFANKDVKVRRNIEELRGDSVPEHVR